ncbi:probable acyltransferase invovled in MEL production [Sporisorium scitamineum]|uniref:Probable acyltransferase invovled in MEL production n=1 Tax=Sporisorium scitamineum TaxID=49012 RepID=A0A0F7S271_9BASI|nr:probable acyltransferase invovled in MEL production [Sporisorium scitamineum]CDW96967.1 hypothetical protein [Sporisorium scitamineum]
MQAEQAWKQVSSHLARRPLIGVEKLLNYTEYYQNGNFQLTIALPFETSLSPETLQQRFGLAVWMARGHMPELGTWTVHTTSDSSLDLDHATFTAIQTVREAQQWIDETIVLVEDGRTIEETINLTSNQRIEPAGKQFRIYLVANPRDGKPGIVTNASHVLNGHRINAQGCAVLQALVDARLAALFQANPDPRAALEAVFVPEDLSRLLRKLPISLNTAYSDKFKPGPEQLEAGMDKISERMSNSMMPTIGIPRFESPAKNPEYSLGVLNGQPMTMLNLRRKIGTAEHRQLHQAYRKRGSSLPSFVYACIVNSIDRRCNASTAQDGETPGANLAYSAHASRWFPAETFITLSPVNMAIVMGSGYLSPEELRSPQRGSNLNQDELFALAKTIRNKQNAYLDHPHIISATEQIGNDLAAMLQDTAIKQQQAGTDNYVALSENSPAICPPTLTSQGDVRFKTFFTAQGASFEPTPLQPQEEFIHINGGFVCGRTTDASVCFAMFSFLGSLTLQAHFDSRFFDAKLIDTILDDVWSQLRVLATNDSATDAHKAKL